MFGGSFSLSGGYRKKIKKGLRKKLKSKRHCGPGHFNRKTSNHCKMYRKRTKKKVKKSRKMRGGQCAGRSNVDKNNQGGGRRSSRKMKGGFGSCGDKNSGFLHGCSGLLHKPTQNGGRRSIKNMRGSGAHNKHKEHQKGGVLKIEPNQ